MVTTSEFKTLIDLAIGEEKKAQKLYKDLAAKADDPYVRAILEGLYEQEVSHEQKLRSLLTSIEPK